MNVNRLKINNEWIKRLKSELTPSRFEHTLSVCQTAYYLALVHKANQKKVVKAAFLHDCTKCMSLDEHLKICKNAAYEPTKYESENLGLIHSKTGAIVARDVYGVKSKKVLNAIRFHTTGRPEMTKIEKIVFISDFIEPTRNFKFDITYIVDAAFNDLDLAVFYILEITLKHLRNKSKVFDPTTIETYNYYKKLKEEKYGRNQKDS